MTTHYPVNPDPRFAADCGFLGNRLPDHEARVKNVAGPASLPAQAFCARRQRLGRQAESGQCACGSAMSIRADHNAFNCTAQTVLNIDRSSMARYGFSPATRVSLKRLSRACLITRA